MGYNKPKCNYGVKRKPFIPHDVSYKYVTHENETYIFSGCPKNLQIRSIK